MGKKSFFSKKKSINKKGLTMVELVIVITIIAILPMFALYSYNVNLIETRDTHRITQLNDLSQAIKYYKNGKELPLPDNSVEVRVDGITYAYQGYVGKNFLNTISYGGNHDNVLDPKDDTYYIYTVSKDKRYFQLMTYLEKSDSLTSYFIKKVNAALDYSKRIPYTVGDKVGIIMQKNTNIPVNEIATFSGPGFIDFTGSLVGEYKLLLSENDYFTSPDNTKVGDKIEDLLKKVKAFSCGDNITITYNSVDYTYTTLLGPDGKCWTSTNMKHGNMLSTGGIIPSDINTIEKWCYNNDSNICNTDGALYTWAEAMGFPDSCNTTNCTQAEDITKSVCGQLGSGWHLPSDTEQYNLENASKSIGQTCISTRIGWDCNGSGWKGNKLSGIFSILPGSRDIDGSFYYRGTNGFGWSSTEDSSILSWRRNLHSVNDFMYRFRAYKVVGFSVICIKN